MWGGLYSAREQINKEKRRENEKLNAWRITRWSAKNKKKKASFLWTLSLIAIIVFIILIFNISNIKENKNIEHANVIQNKNTKENSSQITHKNEVKKSFSEKLKYDEKGILTITSKKEVSILFVQKGSNKQFRPDLAVLEHDLSLGHVPHLGVVGHHDDDGPDDRSEERRVGKECRSRWSPYH